MSELSVIKVGDLEIKKTTVDGNDYLCISDFVPKEGTVGSGITIINWLSSKRTIEFLGLWEQLNNKSFNVMELHNIKNKASDDGRFSISVKKWTEQTNAIGINAKSGRYNSGTYAHVDIALEFASWLSPEFKLYLITEFQRLKKQEAERNNELADWGNYRWLAKANFKLHTDAIQTYVVPTLTEQGKKWIYPEETDMINAAVFGMKAWEFKKQCPEISNQGKNLRDVASKAALQIVANLESSNATMMAEGVSQEERCKKLFQQAENQKRALGLNSKNKLYKTSESELLHQDLLRLDFFKNIKQEALLIETKTKK